MWTILIITAVLSQPSVAEFPAGDRIFDFPRAVLEAELSSYASSAAAAQPCNGGLLVQCQHAFNDDLEIHGSADWKDPNLLFSELGRIYETGVAGVIKICNARIKFYQCLGNTYDSCINPLFFIQDGLSVENSFAYMRAMNRLQFACGSGFLTGVQNYQCLITIRNNSVAASNLEKCDQSFNNSIHEPFGQICSSLQSNAVLSCYWSEYLSNCGYPAAWYICEDIRSAVSNLCPDLKCGVLAPPEEASAQQSDKSAEQLVPHFDAETLARSQGLGFVQRSIFQSLPALTAEEEEAEERQKAASIAEEVKRRREQTAVD